MNGAIRRRGLYNEADEVIATAIPKIKDYEAMVTRHLRLLHAAGLTKKVDTLTKKEAAAITSLGVLSNTGGGRDGTDFSYMQWFTNITSIAASLQASDYPKNVTVITGPKVCSFDNFALYRLNDNSNTIIFLCTIPSTSKSSQYALGYGESAAKIYVPDIAYDAWATNLSNVMSYNPNAQLLRISELPDEYKAKIKVVDINTLIGNR